MRCMATVTCPGCRLVFDADPAAPTHGYFNHCGACWALYGTILAAEYENPAMFGAVHSLTVDAYAVQHAGGAHPDKSVDIHLAGLHLALVRGVGAREVPRMLKRIADTVTEYPHWTPPSSATLTVRDVAGAETADEHARRVRAWAAAVWVAWSEHHAAIAAFVARALPR